MGLNGIICADNSYTLSHNSFVVFISLLSVKTNTKLFMIRLQQQQLYLLMTRLYRLDLIKIVEKEKLICFFLTLSFLSSLSEKTIFVLIRGFIIIRCIQKDFGACSRQFTGCLVCRKKVFFSIPLCSICIRSKTVLNLPFISFVDHSSMDNRNKRMQN